MLVSGTSKEMSFVWTAYWRLATNDWGQGGGGGLVDQTILRQGWGLQPFKTSLCSLFHPRIYTIHMKGTKVSNSRPHI